MKKTSNISASHIVTLREKNELTQQQFATVISQKMKREKPYTVPLISAWETGRRTPTAATANCMAEMFGVTAEYILGKTDDEEETSALISEKSLSENKISFELLHQYDGRPVYITFPQHEHKDAWGIVKADDHKIFIITRNDNIPVDGKSSYIIYPNEMDEVKIECINKCNPLGIIQMINSRKPVWLQMLSADKEVRTTYNGWYILTDDNTFLQGDIGIILPISGLNVSYKCYAESTRL